MFGGGVRESSSLLVGAGTRGAFYAGGDILPPAGAIDAYGDGESRLPQP